jgi:hypothetical protein
MVCKTYFVTCCTQSFTNWTVEERPFSAYHLSEGDRWQFDSVTGIPPTLAAKIVTGWNDQCQYTTFYLARGNAEIACDQRNMGIPYAKKPKGLHDKLVLDALNGVSHTVGEVLDMNFGIWNPKTKKWDGEYTGTMTKGQFRRLPKASSPMFTQQYAYRGSAKTPYIISRKSIGGGTVIEWQCGCGSWTSTVPRTDCKHIIEIKKAEGLLVDISQGLDALKPKVAKAFAAAMKPKALAAAVPGEPVQLFATGRKFRS